ncbi:MAG: ribonuclease HII [Candidatus Asgardarchaeum californiense]|nr:MAG: ribonuclease HII [Candidatus Asgardarchaeum californiense]
MICGVDEAGRGPVVGPLVISGVTFENESELERIGVRDSKKIAPKRREYLAGIIKKVAVNYEILVISASDIDDMRKVMTLNEIEVNAFSKVIGKLKPDICYVDAADVDAIRFGKNILLRLPYKPRIISEHKADDIYPVVAAASILAKTTRDKHIRKIAYDLEKKMSIPLGSGYPADPITKKFLETWLTKYDELPSHVRHSWKTAQKLINKSKTKKLDDF